MLRPLVKIIPIIVEDEFRNLLTMYYHLEKFTLTVSQCVTSLSYFYRTLYCAKGNYEFGISRVVKSLEPHNKKLGTDTW